MDMALMHTINAFALPLLSLAVVLLTFKAGLVLHSRAKAAPGPQQGGGTGRRRLPAPGPEPRAEALPGRSTVAH